MANAVMPKLSTKSLSSDFEAIFRECSPIVYRTARAITGNSEDAEDVVQTIFLRLLRTDHSQQLNKNPKAYLYRAAVNMSLDVLRGQTRRTFTDNIDQLETPVASPDVRFADEWHRRLNEALAELNPDAAEILILRYVHEYSDAEISKLLGTSRGAIALRLFRLRARLRKRLGGFKGERL